MLSTVLKSACRVTLVFLLSGCNFGTLSFSERDDHPPGYIPPNVILPKTLVLSSSDTAEVGMCSAVQIISQDANGKVALVAAAEPVSISVTGGSVSLFSDSACSVPATSVTIAKLTSSATFYVKPLLNAGFTAVALSNKLGFNSKFVASFRAARQMRFVTAPSDIEGGYCGSEIKVGVRDAVGVDFAYTGDMPITGLPPGVSAYATNDCTGPAITQLSFVNSNDKSFHLKTMSHLTLSPVVSAPASTATLTGTLTGTIQSRPAPYSLELDQAFTGLRLGEFSQTAARVRVKDSAGVLFSPPAGLTIGIAAATGAGQFNTSGSGTANPSLNVSVDSTAGASFFVRPMSAGASPSVSYQALTTYRGRSFSATSAALPITVIAAQLAVTISPTVEGGYCSGEHRVQVRDALGVAFNYTGSISVTGLSGDLYTANDCSGTALSSLNYSNSSTASFYVKTLLIGNQGLTFGLPADPPSLAVNLPFTVVSTSAPYDLVLDQVSASLRLGEYGTTQARVRVKNSAGTIFTPAAPGFGVTASINSGTGELSTSSSTTGTTSLGLTLGASALFFVKPTTVTLVSPKVGYQVTGTYRGRVMTEVSGDITVLVVAKTVKLYAGSEGAEINSLALGSGACSPQMTVTLRDGLGRRFTAAANTTVTVTFGAGPTLSLFHDENCSDPVTAGRPISISAAGVSDIFHFRESNEAVTSRTLTGSSTGVTAGTFPVTFSRQPFTADPGFGTNGTQSVSLDGIDVVSGLVQSSTGKYIVVGRTRAGTGQFRAGVAMLSASGKLDLGFNTTGKLGSSGTGTVNCTEARANAVVSVGSAFFIAGKCDSDFFMQRINETGSVLVSDRATFVPATAEAFAIAASSGGNVYLAGVAVEAAGNQFAVARYNSLGVPQGAVEIPLGALGTLVDVKGMTVQRVGVVDKLVLLATIKNAANDNDMALCRMVDSPTPGLDTGFGTNGCQMFDNAARADSAAALLVVGGKLLAVGTSAAADASTSSFLMAQTDANGALDLGFGNGAAHLATHANGKIEAFAAASFTSSTGQILVAGHRLVSSDPSWYVARFSASGALDGAPAPSSKIFPNTVVDTNQPEFVGGVVIGSDNKPVIAGPVGANLWVTQVLH